MSEFGFDECTEMIVVKPAYFCFEACGIQRFHFQEVQGSARDWFCILPRMKKSMALFHIKKFSCHVTLATFKKENFNMWVTSGSFLGHIRIALWVSGSNGSTGMTHFQP